jgi:hypothetical protein
MDLGGRLAATPNMTKRQESAAGIAEKRATTAKTVEATTKAMEERKAEPTQAYGTLGGAFEGLNRMEDMAREVRDHPFLSNAAGPVGSRLWTLRADTANVEAKLEALKSRIAISALQAMRDASKTGGALGNVSDKDLDLLKNSIASLELRQSPEQLRQGLDVVVQHTQNLRDRMSRGYAATYGTPPAALPVAVQQRLKEGVPAKLGNGQVWVKESGVPRRVR